jgi:hypothetical protein
MHRFRWMGLYVILVTATVACVIGVVAALRT